MSFHSLRPTQFKCRTSQITAQADPLLLRVARGEGAERTPVWLMRQAGRYMRAFRKFSDKYPFRARSETPDIAVELSLQPYEAFGVDGVILFSDILTPLPAMGIEFDIVKGSGPCIEQPVIDAERLENVRTLIDPAEQLPFVGEILDRLRRELRNSGVALIGFIGTPWTLAAYSIEGKASKNCLRTKGNVDPLELCGTEASLTAAVQSCLSDGGGSRHILNLGHGVIQQTPEENVTLFCSLAKASETSRV